MKTPLNSNSHRYSLKKSSVASFCVWIIVLAGYPFDFRYAFGYPFMIPILCGLGVLSLMLMNDARTIGTRLNKTFFVLFATLVCFWLFQIGIRLDISYVSNIFQVFCIAVIYLAIVNYIGEESISRQFVNLMIINCIGGTIVTLLLLVHNFPPLFQFAQHDGRVGNFYFLTFTNTAFVSDSFTVIRYSGMFDEPGALSYGCMFALILNKLKLKSQKAEWLLLILPIFTFSMAHIITSILYILFFYWRKPKLIIGLCVLLLGIFFISESLKYTDYSRIYNLVSERLTNAGGFAEGEIRGEEANICKTYFTQRPLVGWGKTFFEQGAITGVVGTNIFYNGALYGILGFIFPYIIIIYFIIFLPLQVHAIPDALDGLKCFLLIVVNLFQRSYITSIFPLFSLTLVALCVYNMTKRNKISYIAYV